jgi:hypothetical protein
MTAWLSPANIGRLVALLAVAILSSWATQSCTGPAEKPAVQPRVETDTVYRERQITRRDTVRCRHRAGHDPH